MLLFSVYPFLKYMSRCLSLLLPVPVVEVYDSVLPVPVLEVQTFVLTLPVLVVGGEAVDDDGDGQGEDKDAQQSAHTSGQLGEEGLKHHRVRIDVKHTVAEERDFEE